MKPSVLVIILSVLIFPKCNSGTTIYETVDWLNVIAETYLGTITFYDDGIIYKNYSTYNSGQWKIFARDVTAIRFNKTTNGLTELVIMGKWKTLDDTTSDIREINSLGIGISREIPDDLIKRTEKAIKHFAELNGATVLDNSIF